MAHPSRTLRRVGMQTACAVLLLLLLLCLPFCLSFRKRSGGICGCACRCLFSFLSSRRDLLLQLPLPLQLGTARLHLASRAHREAATALPKTGSPASVLARWGVTPGRRRSRSDRIIAFAFAFAVAFFPFNKTNQFNHLHPTPSKNLPNSLVKPQNPPNQLQKSHNLLKINNL